MLDGLSRINPLVRRVHELGMDSVGITDHGGIYGAIDFYRAAREMGIKPIIGCEMYVAHGSRHSRDPSDKTSNHLTVLAKNGVGYRNLVKLVTKSHLEGFYYKPRVDRELLVEHRDGLIVLSGCPSGEVSSLLAQGRMEEAEAAALWYKDLFEDYYFELMEHGGVPGLPSINNGLMQLHRKLDVPVVATNDSHYVNREDARLQDILICIHTNTNINDANRLRMVEDSYYLRSPHEMQALFPEIPEAVTNTQRITEMCHLELDFSQLRMPEFRVPDGSTADEYLAKLCWAGLRRRIERATAEEEKRLEYELEVIKQTRFANYFLVVWDIARFVRENDIYLAVRGSATASLTLYCLDVTDVNPLRYRLVFERFLNVERKEMPDIDMDFQDDRREEVINYVVSKYGREHVAQIITFGTLGARASIRDVGRALAMPYADVDRVARLVPFKLHITLDEAIELNPELRESYEADDTVKTLVDTARGLEGVARHSSTHAAGVVISKEPLDDVVPLQRPVRGDAYGVNTTQYAMGPIAALGLLKMDFLGLANLTILARTRELISNTWGIDVTLQDIPLDDSATFELLSRGETVGVFQLEGSGMTRYIKELKPTSLSDVAAMIALYRPGPMEHITTFIDAKHGRSEPRYPHPALRDILEETYGVIVYQDQVLLIAQAFAGYSLGEADIVRKAMGKKIPEIMAQERQRFIDGALDEGYSEALANEVFALIEPFAGYAFNKAHSVSYGLISYWTAYLKANYPAEYMVSLLNSYIDNTDKIAVGVAECRRLKIPVLFPNINSGGIEFSIQDYDGQKAIRFGMGAIKNVGAAALVPVLESREETGPFTSVEHMCRVADVSGVNRKTLESLIKAGALDDFGDRGALLGVVDRILALAQSEAKLRNSDQTSMFDLFGETVPTPLVQIAVAETTTPDGERRAWEIELLGVTFSSTAALHNVLYSGDSEAISFRSDINADMGGKKVVVVGQLSSVSRRLTRDQRPYAIAVLSLMDGSIEAFVWEELLQDTDGLWEEGKLVSIAGTIRVRDDQISISCTEANEYKLPDSAVAPDDHDVAAGQVVVASAPGDTTPAPKERETVGASAPREPVPVESVGGPTGPPAEGRTAAGARCLRLSIRERGEPASDQTLLADLRRLLLEYLGPDEVKLEIATEGRIVTLEWPPVRVNACAELEQGLQELLGDAGHVMVESAT